MLRKSSSSIFGKSRGRDYKKKCSEPNSASGYREYVSLYLKLSLLLNTHNNTLYYCVYSTIEIALSARSSKYDMQSKQIVYILHLMYLSTINSYCNCLELLKNMFTIYIRTIISQNINFSYNGNGFRHPRTQNVFWQSIFWFYSLKFELR